MRSTLTSLTRWMGFAASGVILISPVARAESAQDLVNEGETAEKAGNVDQAVQKYTQALDENPGFEGAALDLSLVYRRAEEYGKAIAALNKALEENPTSVRIANNLGVCYRLDKQYAAAETVFRAALARSPGDLDTYKNMAVLFYDQNQLALAEQFSIEAKKMNDKDSGIWNNLGLIYYKKDGADHPTRALGAFKKAVELNPNDEEAWHNIGAISIRYRDYGNAEKAFANAARIDPELYTNHLYYAYALDGGKKYDQALKEYDAAFEKKNDLYEVYYAKGLIYQTLQKWKDAKDNCQKFLDTRPDNAAEVTKADACVKSGTQMLQFLEHPQPPPAAPAPAAPAANHAPAAKPADRPAAKAPAAAPANNGQAKATTAPAAGTDGGATKASADAAH